jgi:hypothetical protein
MLLRLFRRISYTGLVLVGGCATQVSATQTLRLPLHVYRYSFAAAPELNSTLSNAETKELIDRVNRVWERANIRWDLQSVSDRSVDAKDFPELTGSEDRNDIRERLLAVAPVDTSGRGWNVAVIREFPVPAGGLYLPKARVVYFAERARGGETSAVVLAHELGHSLGLSHSRETRNLMHRAAGARGLETENATALSPDQISTVRTQALNGLIARESLNGDYPAIESNRPGRQINDMPDRARAGPSPARRKRIVERLESFDLDNDGVIHIEDVPDRGRSAFRRMDTNQDGKLDETELAEFSQGVPSRRR